MIISYLLSVTLLWSLSLLAYHIWFRNNAWHSHNRVFLIATFCAGCLLPMTKEFNLITIDKFSSVGNVVGTIQENSEQLLFHTDSAHTYSTVNNSTTVTELTQSTNNLDIIGSILLVIYFLGVFISLLKYTIGLYTIYKIYRSGEKVEIDECHIIVHERDILPFSFFNHIYLHARVLKSPGLQSFMLHEQAHISGRHSVDRMLMGIMKIVFWFHPQVYRYTSLLKETHEFTADNHASNNTQKYDKALVDVMQYNSLLLVNNFHGSNFKRRINMLNRTTNKSIRPYLLFIPVFICLVIVTSCNTTSSETISDYVLGATLENIILDNFFDSDRITEAYNQLKETHPDHIDYMQNRIQHHFKELGGEILFDENEIRDHISKSAFSDRFPKGDATIQYIVTSPLTTKNNLPTLRPIRSSDLKDEVKPGPRIHPIKKIKVQHRGIDYEANLGSDVVAAGDGIITSTRNFKSGYGHCIRVNHNHGMESFYAHLSEILVKEGQYIKKGDIIGKVGNSGLATAPHLHFELTRDGEQWDYDVISQSIN